MDGVRSAVDADGVWDAEIPGEFLLEGPHFFGEHVAARSQEPPRSLVDFRLQLEVLRNEIHRRITRDAP
jgi:hypothetical protein